MPFTNPTQPNGTTRAPSKPLLLLRGTELTPQPPHVPLQQLSSSGSPLADGAVPAQRHNYNQPPPAALPGPMRRKLPRADYRG